MSLDEIKGLKEANDYLREQLNKQDQEIADLRASAALRSEADFRAIKQWRLEKPEARELKQPDHVDLVMWLTDQLILAQHELEMRKEKKLSEVLQGELKGYLKSATDEIQLWKKRYEDEVEQRKIQSNSGVAIIERMELFAAMLYEIVVGEPCQEYEPGCPACEVMKLLNEMHMTIPEAALDEAKKRLEQGQDHTEHK